MILADLHVHTTYSPDSAITPGTLVERLHSHPYFKVQELAAAYGDVLVIPGMKITTPEGDLILLGVRELPPKPWNAKDVVDFTRSKGGAVIVAHSESTVWEI